MGRAKHAYSVKTKGNYLGVKINTTSKMFSKMIKDASYDSREAFLKDVMPVMDKRFREILPKYRAQLIKGTTAFGGDPLLNVKGGKRAEGLASYESKAHGSHRPHKQIPDPLSRLVSEKGMSIKLKRVRDKFELKTNFKRTRRHYINFYKTMPSLPRASTVARRFDETCLPFIRSGRFEELTEIYAANAAYSLSMAVIKHLNDRGVSL